MTAVPSDRVICVALAEDSSPAFNLRSSNSNDGHWTIQVSGNFDSATAKLEASLDNGGTWSPVEGGDFTIPLVRSLRLKNCLIHLLITDPGDATSINAWISD